MNMGKVLVAGAAAFFATATASASIITVDAGDIGNVYSVNYDGFADGNIIDGLTGEASFKLTAFDGTSVTFDYAVTNTSGTPIDTSRISIFGFNTDPNISGATVSGDFTRTAYNSNVPSGFGSVDVCFKGSGGPNCSGGGGTGVTIGETATGSLTLSFSSAIDQLTLSDFFVRYQSITGGNAPGSAIGRGTTSSTSTSTSTSTGGTPVPAPAAPLLFAIGLGFIGWRYGWKARPARA
ncbi:MAG: cistern family PEP-CTERM protein [Allosphingosinicella sp.]